MQSDECTTDIDNVLQTIIRFSSFLDYREKLTGIISMLQLGKLTHTNVFIDEIIGFKSYLERNINNFLVFDYTIKWMEIINYMCSLISISRRGINVSLELLPRINNADFIKWSDVRKKEAKDEKVNKTLSKVFNPNEHIFATFCWIWEKITSRAYHFSKYSINELLHALRELRNYTRGHGVFSFEISQEINLALVEILIFLINQLVENNLLDNSYDNLAELGWVVYVGDIPYFLYSYDNRYQSNIQPYYSGVGIGAEKYVFEEEVRKFSRKQHRPPIITNSEDSPIGIYRITYKHANYYHELMLHLWEEKTLTKSILKQIINQALYKNHPEGSLLIEVPGYTPELIKASADLGLELVGTIPNYLCHDDELHHKYFYVITSQKWYSVQE